jgi:hypothetical protein
MKTISISAFAGAAGLIAALTATMTAGSAQAQQAAKLFFEGDIVRHAMPGHAGPFCVLVNQFRRKEAAAFRIRVLQPSGDVADDRVLRSVVVELGDGQRLPAHFGPHGSPPTDYFWSLHWVIPPDYPTGSLGYKVIATTNDGAVAEWKPFNRATTALMVVPGEPETRPANFR